MTIRWSVENTDYSVVRDKISSASGKSPVKSPVSRQVSSSFEVGRIMNVDRHYPTFAIIPFLIDTCIIWQIIYKIIQVIKPCL